MTNNLKVFVNAPAPLVVAGWLDKVLGSAIQACRFAGDPPPVELRSRMQPAGLFRPGDTDGRVLLAGRATLWSRFSLVQTYLHEVGHALCERALHEHHIEAHGPVFCLVVACLYQRAAAIGHLAGLPSSISFYDFADQPRALANVADWRSEVVRFLTTESRKLAESESSAESLPENAQESWSRFISSRDERAKDELETAKQAAELTQENSKLQAKVMAYRSNLKLWISVASIGWFFAIFNGAACQSK